MTVNKKRKVTKYRGSHTHGGGAKKKRRGAGNRGGVGMAGTGKRADQKKPTILKLYGNSYFGKHGFSSKSTKNIKSINLDSIQTSLMNKAKQEKDVFILDITSLGYDKLLGRGKVTKKFSITCKICTEKAKQKIEKSGGEVILKE
jgi:large subunit ribosomal protein L15